MDDGGGFCYFFFIANRGFRATGRKYNDQDWNEKSFHDWVPWGREVK